MNFCLQVTSISTKTGSIRKVALTAATTNGVVTLAATDIKVVHNFFFVHFFVFDYFFH